MDVVILISSMISFIVFCVAQMIVFRYIEEDRVLLWLMKLFFLVEGCSLMAGYFLWGQYAYVTIALWHAVIFFLLLVSYILSIFSFSEASITLRLLSEIARHGNHGITKKEILIRYNLGVIVGRRLSRFVASGELVVKGQLYRWKNSPSFFELREKTVEIVKRLFP
jgi:hypothetical protein